MNQPHSPTNVLLVDDDPSMVRLLAKLIQRSDEPLLLETLTDPAAALERLDRGGVDVLISDLDMPGINGLDLLRCAKRRNACTQVFLLTGNSTQESLIEALETGATDYLLKPVKRELLLELIHEAARRQVRWQQALAATWKKRRALV